MQQKKLQEVTLVEGTEADLPRFFALEQRLNGPTYRGETKREDVFGNGKFIYLIQAGDNIVGQLQYENQKDNTVYLNVLAIDPQFQKKGYGREALKQFLDKVQDASKVWLVTHPENRAIKLYESFGFKITEEKENYFGNGTPRVLMVLDR